MQVPLEVVTTSAEGERQSCKNLDKTSFWQDNLKRTIVREWWSTRFYDEIRDFQVIQPP